MLAPVLKVEQVGKQLKSESLAEVQFVFDRCCLASQSNKLKNFNKDCDWLILVCFIREHCMADTTNMPLENKVWFENFSKCEEKLLNSLS